MRCSESLSYAGARAIIGSMWIIYDKSAVEFAYQLIGTLNCHFNSGTPEFDPEEQKYIMMLKFIDTLEFSLILKRLGLVYAEDIESLRKIFKIAELISHTIDKSEKQIFRRLESIRSQLK